MKPLSALAVLLMLGASFVPLLACGGEHGGEFEIFPADPPGGLPLAGTGPPTIPRADSYFLPEPTAPPCGGPRAEPEYENLSVHEMAAVYDFSNTFMFARWAIVMETGRARLMKDIAFENDSWASLAPLPSGAERANPVAVWDDADSLVIVQGGRNGTGPGAVHSQPLYVYDPAADAWTARGPSRLPDGAAGVWNSRDRCLMVCGGAEMVGGSSVIHNETWAWFPSNGTWLRLADMPGARQGQCAVWDSADSRMLVFGGLDAAGYYNDIWSYGFTANSWKVLAPAADEYPLVRARSSAVWDPGKKEMLVFGGENPNVTFLSTWAYSYANNTWIHRSSSPFALSMHGACWDSDRGMMTAVGGRWHPGTGQYEYYNCTWTYDSGSDSWGPNSPLPGALRSGSAGVYDPVRKRMLVIGGQDSSGNCLGETWSFAPGNLSWSYYSPGYMQPPVLDLGEGFHSLDEVRWEEGLAPGTDIRFKLCTSDDNSTWRTWEPVENGGRPQQQGRYVMWNMTFTASTDLLSTPALWGVRFNCTVNQRPDCSAGADLSAFKRETVALQGGGSDPDGDPLTYKWTKASPLAGDLEDPGSPAARYTPRAAGTHSLRLVVNDGFADSAASFAKVTVPNRPPAVSAGTDRTGYKNESLNLGGNATDPDGDALSFNWSQLAGPRVTLVPPDALSTSFTPVKAGNYSFQLKADDGENSTWATVNLTVLNRRPLARLEASPARAGINERVNFSAANSTDPDGYVARYLIDFGDGNGTGWMYRSSIGYYYTAPGAYNATLAVMDDDGDLSAVLASVGISIENALPVIEASVSPAKGEVTTRFRFTVGTGSHDPDGSIVSYEWDFGDGRSGSGTEATHTYARRGNYTAVLRATDDLGGFSELRLNVSVANRAPVILSASPGKSPSIGPDEVARFSVNAEDPDGDALTYTWRIDGQAAGGNSSALTYQAADAAGRRISVTVSDGEEEVTYEWSLSIQEKARGPTLPWLAGVLLLIAAVGGFAAWLALRRSRGRRPGPARPGDQGSGRTGDHR